MYHLTHTRTLVVVVFWWGPGSQRQHTQPQNRSIRWLYRLRCLFIYFFAQKNLLSIGYICKNSSNNNSSSTAAEKQTARKYTHKHISIYSTKNDRVRLLKTHGCCSLFPVIVYCTNSVCVSFLLVCALLPKHFWLLMLLLLFFLMYICKMYMNSPLFSR